MRERLDLSAWEVAMIGAEPISPRLLREFSRAFAPCGFRAEAFFPVYGLAEATLLVSSGDPTKETVSHTLESTALAA